jgi:hypothetical protein
VLTEFGGMELSYSPDGYVKLHSHLENKLLFLKAGCTAIPFLYIHSRDKISYVHIRNCVWMFIEVLFVIVPI